MENQTALDESLKQAQIDKTLAEAEKLRREANAADRQFREAHQTELDEKLKQAQIDKTLAEAEKLKREAAAADRQFREAKWTEPLKLFGAVILGVGGVVAAITQYEVAELKAKAAQHDLTLAEKARGDADTATKVAIDRQRTAEVQTAQAVSLAASASQVRANAEAAASAAKRQLLDAKQQADKAQQELTQAQAAREAIERDVARLKVELGESAGQLRVAQGQVTQARTKLEQEVLAGLQPKAANLALKLIERAREQGIQLRLIAGFRSAQQQEALYAQGRSAPGQRVTNARISVHNTGLAFDVAVVVDGKLEFDTKQYATLGPIGRELGLVWGGDQRFPDMPHFETADAQDALKELIRSSKSSTDQ